MLELCIWLFLMTLNEPGINRSHLSLWTVMTVTQFCIM